MLTVAIQGIKGSFHDEAAGKLVPEGTSVECTTFQDVFDAVVSGSTDYGVVAIENSIHGSINPVYRLLARTKLWIAGEATLQIEQFLIGTTDTVSIEELNTPQTEVRTMFPAFAQSELWLNEYLPNAQRIELYDTAYAVKTITEEKNPYHVSIGGSYAAEMYGGHIVAGPINDDPNNYTRFVLLSKKHVTVSNANRTTLILTARHEKGALFEALGILAKHDISLSKLDSHPIPSDTRRYAFYTDLDAALHAKEVETALSELKDAGCGVEILGSYKVT